MQISLVSLNARFTHSCLALFYVRKALADWLPQASVSLRQFTINDPPYDTLLRITAPRPDAVFFSVYIWNALAISRLVLDLRRIAPDTAIVLGGPGTACLDESARRGCTVVRGQIEGVSESFYADLQGDKLQAEYIAAPGRPFGMPYRDEDFTGPLQNRQIYYESSRGCPHACSYCLSSVERGLRNRDLDEVRRELAMLLEHRPKVVRFVDRTFNASAERALEIWRFLAARPEETLFHFEIAPDLFNEEMFEFLQSVKPGKFQFEIGLQSTNPKTLAAVHRKMDVARAQENIARLVLFDNIHLHADLILGLPYETRETFRQSFRDVFLLAPHYIQMGLLKVLPGTAIRRERKAFGIKACSQPPYAILANRWLDHAALSRLYWFGECVEAFYNNRFFRALWGSLRKREEEPFAFFEELLRVCQRHNFFELAKTQELMSRMLFRLAEKRPDRDLFIELLRFDWLRSGHRFLPEYLGPGGPRQDRDHLWRQLPENLPPLYTARSRSNFFKHAAFAKFSAPALRETGHGDGGGDGFLVFLPEKAPGVLPAQRTMLLRW